MENERENARRANARRLRPSGRRRCVVLSPVPSLVLVLVAVGLVGTLGGCASQGDFLRLQERVEAAHRSGRGAPDPFARIAQLAAEVDAMRKEIRTLEGELEVARKESADALAQVRRARTSLAEQSLAEPVVLGPDGLPVSGGPQAGGPATGGLPGATNPIPSAPGQPPIARTTPIPPGSQPAPVIAAPTPPAPAPPPPPRADRELVSYQAALESWRSDDYATCIKRFTGFLQSYPTSGYADDAAYWLADCTFKKGEYKRAVIRFSDVVRVYPDSPKAPDALYRQGESLLKLGPRFKDAARTVFRSVQEDYPESKRAVEAARQLERLGPREKSAT